MKRIFTISIILTLIFNISGVSQNTMDTDFLPGEIMIQLTDKEDLSQLLVSHGLDLKHVVSDRFNIYLCEIRDSRISNNSMISMLKKQKAVVNVQNNHHVTLRSVEELVPNDSIFEDQWSMLNTGQGSGTAGADIDATKAWDITTGGLTALGDTIVVAIIDGGSDLDHEDLNFWKNHAEIPGNNIDDDNNGYVDDYDGWNAYNHSGQIPDNVHGVHVCGTAGAIGNNEVGVAGVNWNVKTLPIAGESSYESIVVEALSYVYVVRERYDETDGAEGAFIVAQNNSFGVDKGLPANFPIWEAMYDSLGALGVLSMGATANRGWDIDSVSDVPTAFTTDYMISVTNTTNKDLKNTSAGYGTTTIDLGAPGTMIWSLGLNDSYRMSSGTSMATPHVTGAAALLMAAADSIFMVEYKANPGAGALKIKEFILDGVDPLPDLEGITVSGGRLNVFNSLNLLLDTVEIAVYPTEFSEELPLIYNLQKELIITNLGSDTVEYDIVIDDQPDWISVSQYGGLIEPDESDTLIVSLNSISLDTGVYNCIIKVEAEGSLLKTVPVMLKVYDDTGIEDNSQFSSVSVYPVPFDSSVEFSIEEPENDTYLLEIFDIHGRRIYSKTKTASNEIMKFIWENNEDGSGIFLYRISYSDGILSSGRILKN